MSAVLVPALTARERRYAQFRIEGFDKKTSALKAGFGPWIAEKASQRIESPEILSVIEQAERELTAYAVQQGLMTAEEIHEDLTDILRGDIADLYDENDQLKPKREWPRWARLGGVEIMDEPNMVHSADEGGSSWDQVGRKIKIRAGSRTKERELLMKHKGVNAMVEQKSGDTNILIVNADTARKVVSAKKRLEKVIDVKPEE